MKLRTAGSILATVGTLIGSWISISTMGLGLMSLVVIKNPIALTMGVYGTVISVILFVLSICSYSTNRNMVAILLLIVSATNIIVGGSFVLLPMIIILSGAICQLVYFNKHNNDNITIKNFYKEKAIVGVLVLSIIAIVIVSNMVNKYDPSSKKKIETSERKQIQTISITSPEQMFTEYYENETAANLKYANKNIIVTGIVENITDLSDDSSSVRLKCDKYWLNSFECIIPDRVAVTLLKDKEITILGYFGEMGIFNDIKLQNCTIQDKR